MNSTFSLPFRRVASGARAVAILATLVLVALAFSVAPALAAGLSDPSLLTKHNGSMTVTEDGAVIENLEIHGALRIEANNVLVRNVWVYGSEFWSVYVASGSARFEDVEIGHKSYPGSRGIGGNNIVAIGVYIHFVEDGIKLGSNSTYSGVYVHDLASPSSSPHSDAVQVEGSSTNSTVKNSYLSSIGPGSIGNSAVIVKSDLGFSSNISFVNNYMNGGNYTIFVRDGGHGMPANISFVDNRFGSTSRYGLASLDGPVTWENNTWADTGDIIDSAGNVISQNTTTTTTKSPSPTSPSPTSPSPTSPSPTSPSPTSPSPTTTTTIASSAVPSPPTATTALEDAATLAIEPVRTDSGSTPRSVSIAIVVGGVAAAVFAGYLTRRLVASRREG